MDPENIEMTQNETLDLTSRQEQAQESNFVGNVLESIINQSIQAVYPSQSSPRRVRPRQEDSQNPDYFTLRELTSQIKSSNEKQESMSAKISQVMANNKKRQERLLKDLATVQETGNVAQAKLLEMCQANQKSILKSLEFNERVKETFSETEIKMNELKNSQDAMSAKFLDIEEALNLLSSQTLNFREAQNVPQPRAEPPRTNAEDDVRMQDDNFVRPDFMTGFAKISPTTTGIDLANQMQRLIDEVKSLKYKFSDLSLLTHLRKAMPSIILSKFRHSGELDEFVQQVEQRYNNPTDLFTTRNEILSWKFSKKTAFSRQAADFLDKINSFNQRCEILGKNGEQWSPFQIIRTLVDKIAPLNREMAENILDLWNNSENTPLWMDAGRVQLQIARIEQKYLWRDAFQKSHGQSKQKTEQEKLALFVNKTNKRAFDWVCWRCDKTYERTPGKVIWCNCNERPTCANCTGCHLTKHHASAAATSFQRKKANWNKTPTQGGNTREDNQDDDQCP